MKQLIGTDVGGYTFDASLRQVTLTGLSTLALEHILLITNVVDGVIIYNFADSAKGGTIAGNVLTLAYDTTLMSNTDSLQIFVDYPGSLSGAGFDDTLTLTSAATAYACPASPPTNAYTLVLSNDSDATVYFRFTEGITGGVVIASAASFTIDLAANTGGFVYCATAGTVINVSSKEM